MPTQKSLRCVLLPDLMPWERYSILSLTERLKSEGVVIVDSPSSLNDWKPPLNATDITWVVSGRWQSALKKIPSRLNGNWFLSILGSDEKKESLSSLFWRKLKPISVKNLHWLTHSPLSYRFFKEIEGVPPDQVSYVPLPMLPDNRMIFEMNKRPFTVGIITRFSGSHNLHYILGVAHYVTRMNSEVRFQIIGSGKHEFHLRRLITELGLNESVKVSDNLNDLAMDALLFSPLQNHHFLPLFAAALYHIPVVTSELPGIEELISDGHSGFVVPMHEIKPMAELILRLSHDPFLQKSMGKKLAETLSPQYTQAAANYSKLLFGPEIVRNPLVKAA